MARFRSGNAIQSKIQMILFGNPFTGKSTMALQSASLKNPDGSPFKVLYLDPASGSVDDYLPPLAENGVDMRNILIAVSYTHLDVYKRQSKGSDKEERFLTNLFPQYMVKAKRTHVAHEYLVWKKMYR